jgi:hypothetical protein
VFPDEEEFVIGLDLNDQPTESNSCVMLSHSSGSDFSQNDVRLSIPIARIAAIAFFAVQVRMHPRTVTALIVLSKRVSAFPVPSRVPPQCSQRWRELCRRLVVRKRSFEILYRHCSLKCSA